MSTGDGRTKPESGPKPALGTGIFLVHGHDLGMKETVARFLEHLNFEVTVLQEESDDGSTVIEKFEKHANAGFAVVLLTGDDIGGPKSTPDKLQPRARQNVILELGYFIGRLDRKRVAALRSPGVEVPSDLAGIVDIEIDQGDGWRWKLARRMKAGGLPVDLNLVAD